MLRNFDPPQFTVTNDSTEEIVVSSRFFCGNGNRASVFTQILRHQEAQKFITIINYSLKNGIRVHVCSGDS